MVSSLQNAMEEYLLLRMDIGISRHGAMPVGQFAGNAHRFATH
jgi:hypothetical protein